MQAAFQAVLPEGLNRLHSIESFRMSGNSIIGRGGEAVPWAHRAYVTVCLLLLCVCWLSWKVCALMGIPGLELCLCYLLAVRFGLQESLSHVVSLFLPYKAISISL